MNNESQFPEESDDLDNLHDASGLQGEPALKKIWNETWKQIEQRGYIVDREKCYLGEGGSAVVIKAKAKVNHRRVAIKIYVETDNKHRALFQQEAKVLAGGHLPADVVHLYESCQGTDSQPFLILEYINGLPIHRYVKEGRNMPMKERLQLVQRLFESMQRFHKADFVYGDLSSNNVLVQGEQIRLIDFGSTRIGVNNSTPSLISTRPATETFVTRRVREGTRPEIVDDIYSTAAVAFHILTDKLNPEHRAKQESMLKKAGVPKKIIRIMLKGLREKNPHKENDPTLYASAEEVANDIQKYFDVRKARKQQLRLGVLALILMIILGSFGASSWWKYRNSTELQKLSQWQTLSQEVLSDEHHDHPGVQKWLGEANQLYEQFQNQRGGQSFSSLKTLESGIEKLERAMQTSREVERSTRLRESLGITLNETPWVLESMFIQKEKSRLDEQYKSIGVKVETGKTERLWEELGGFQMKLAELVKGNTQAERTDQVRRDWQGLSGSISERLQQEARFGDFEKDVKRAEEAWNEGNWELANITYGQTLQNLQDWLKVQGDCVLCYSLNRTFVK